MGPDESKELKRIQKVLTGGKKKDARLACIEDLREKHATTKKAVRMLEFVVESTHDPEDWEVKNQAVITLGDLGSKHSVPQLMGALCDRSPIVRESAAYALGQVVDGRSVPALLGALDDESFTVRENAARSLARIGDDRAIEPLLAKARSPDLEVRLSVISAIGAFAEKHADTRLHEALVDALRDGEMQVRFPAIIAFNKIKHPPAIDALVENLESEDPLLEKVASDALVYNLGWGSVAEGKLTSFGEKRRELLRGTGAKREEPVEPPLELSGKNPFAHLAGAIVSLLRLDVDDAKKLKDWLEPLDERFDIARKPATE